MRVYIDHVHILLYDAPSLCMIVSFLSGRAMDRHQQQGPHG